MKLTTSFERQTKLTLRASTDRKSIEGLCSDSQ
jgi:hypothetical protein